MTICGPLNLPATVPYHASQMYSRNLTAFLLAFWKDGAFAARPRRRDHPRDCLVTHAGEVPHPARPQAEA